MIKKLIKTGLISLSFLAVTGTSTMLSAQNMNQTLSIDPNITIGTLPNGLKYYIKPNPKPEGKVELRLAINAGSILEDEDQLGLAHFLEHMNFNGTKNFPKNELVDYLQSIGVQFGADLNAYTSFDETVYILPIPTTDRKNVDKGFQILADWAQGALLTGEDIDDERNIILEESRMGKGAQDRMSKKFLPKLLAGSRYGERLPIGKDELLKTFTHDALRRFHKEWYRPNLMAVAVVGDITKQEAEALIKKYFSPLTNPKKARKRIAYDIKPYKQAEAMYLTDKEQANTIFLLNFSAKKDDVDKTVGDYRSSMVRNLALMMMNQRYSDLAQSATPPFVFAQSGYDSYVRGYGSLNMALMPNAGDLTTAINTLIGEVINVNKYGFNNTELELSKKNMFSAIEKTYNERNTTNSSNFVNEYVRNYLTGEPMPGIEKEYELYKQLLPTIKLEDVNKVLRDLFDEKDKNSFFALVMSPEANTDPIDTDKSLLEVVKKAFEQTAVEHEEVKIDENLLEALPIPGTIVEKTNDQQLGTTTYTLSNGVKVTVKSTDFKSDEILFKGTKIGGINNYPASDMVYSSILSGSIESMGYGKYTPTELQKALSGVNISLAPAIDDIYSSISGSSDVKNLEKFMQLVYMQLTQPRLDKDLFKAFIDKTKAQLQFVKGNPQSAFIDTLITQAYGNHPYKPVVFPTNEQLNNATAEKALEIYKNEFSNADGFHFYLVGNINEKELIPLMNQYLASLPTRGTQPTYKDVGLRMKKGNNKFVFEKNTEQKSLIYGIYYGEMPYSEAMAMKAAMLGEILTIRVIEDIREKMASIYSGGFSGSFDRLPYAQYKFNMMMPTGPESVESVLKAVDEELTEIKKNGPQAKDLDKVKISLIEKHKENVKKNNYWLAKLEQIYSEGYSKDWFLNVEKEINKVSVTEMKDAANKFFGNSNSFIGILNPIKE